MSRSIVDLTAVLKNERIPKSSITMAASSGTTGKRRSLEHPLHEHELALRHLPEDCRVECHFCKQHLHGSVYYCCEDCDFILHEACAEIDFPPLLQGHPSHHPDHPLELVPERRSYCCNDCGFSLDALTGIATRLPPRDVGEDTIRHFRHEEHPLSFFRVEAMLEVQCGMCEDKISGQVYGCRSCLFLLHEPCARLGLEIQHPLHRQHRLTYVTASTQDERRCKVCRYNAESGPAYCCDEEYCVFALHAGCAASTTKEGSSSSDIKHYSHEHPLTPLHVGDLIQSYMRCSVCRSYISVAEAFACSDCEFFLHKTCAVDLPKEIQRHFLHPQHPRLVLRTTDPHDRRLMSCDAGYCYERYLDLAFSCEDCEFNLDPACALQLQKEIEDGTAPYISHFAHEHRLTLTIRNSGMLTCFSCKQSIVGFAYSCITCNLFWLHTSCADLPLKLEHAYHPQHPLILSEVPARYFFCNACHEKYLCTRIDSGKGYKGLAFYCVECEFYMDVGCASLNLTLKHARHEHRLAYCARNTSKQLHCSSCSKRCRYDFYCCMPCNFSLHSECLDLPPAVDYKSRHWHPLLLCDKFVDGNPDDLFCDYCETIRDPDHGVYHCEECHFSVHIECIVSNYKVEEEESETWGLDRLNQLNIEITRLKAKVVIIRRDLDATRENLDASLEVLAGIETESPFITSPIVPPEMMAKDSIKHPCHEHPLILRMLSERYQWQCSLCKLDIRGSTYCCEGCDYFLHGSCASIELPPEIWHPTHRDHPLTLSGDSGHNYLCNECGDVTVHALTAIATLNDDEQNEEGEEEDIHNKEKDTGEDEEEDKIIHHFAHKEHPLVPFHVEIQLLTECKGCERRISGEAYGCRTCLFLLHASCARAPQVLEHPFGSGFILSQYVYDVGITDTCRGCVKPVEGGFVYSRPDDSGWPYKLHMACALSTKFPRGHRSECSPDFKVHSCHSCPLVLFQIEEETYAPIGCRVCDLKILGEARGCPNCWFFLHQSCLEKLPEAIRHFLHPDHPNLVLEARGELSGYMECKCCCATCQATFYGVYPNAGMAFQCDGCEFYLKPNCAVQTLSAVEEGVAASISHFAHDHPLLLHFSRTTFFRSCTACEQSIDGLSYFCVTCESMLLHKSCAELPQELEHAFHSQHPLVLLPKASVGYFSCSACRKKSTGFGYYCAECDFYLDVKCASVNPTMRHPRHEHQLAYFEESMNDHLLCDACGKRCKKDIYLCVPCGFSLHHGCTPLPPKIVHDGHWLHPLFLRDKFVEGDPNYQYCDHCEELRNPEHGVYHCEECVFSAHINCMISKDKVEVEARATEVEPAEMETNRGKPTPDQANSNVARKKAGIDVMRRYIEATRGKLEALTKEVEELENEKESLGSS